jgi:hypothetical protein
MKYVNEANQTEEGIRMQHGTVTTRESDRTCEALTIVNSEQSIEPSPDLSISNISLMSTSSTVTVVLRVRTIPFTSSSAPITRTADRGMKKVNRHLPAGCLSRNKAGCE